MSGLIKKENNKEAPINPSTNLGKRSQITPAVGFISESFDEGCLVYVQYTDIPKAANPNSTFCENFTMVLIFRATSPTYVPEATTAPVVSIVPPSHAPVTSCENPKYFAIMGIKIIIGIAVISTIDIT